MARELGRSRKRRWGVASLAVGAGVLMLVFGAPQALAFASGTVNPTPKLRLVPGADSASSCVSFPCAHVVSSGDNDVRISFSLGIESTGTLQPETYYTDLVHVTNPSDGNVTLTSISIGHVSATRDADFGAVSVYYCVQQTNTPSLTCTGATVTSPASLVQVFAGSDVLTPGSTRYLELAGFAGTGAVSGDGITFDLEVTSG